MARRGFPLALKAFIDISLILLSYAILAITYKPGYFPVHQRGFFCDDHTIRYPYHPNTVPAVPFFLATLILPIALVLSVEIVNSVLAPNKPIESSSTLPALHYCCKRKVPDFVIYVYKYIGLFMFGYNALLTCVCCLKLWSGRLRPYFLDVCQPDWSKIDCRSHRYVEVIPCTGNASFGLDQARMSFPSGHAAQAFYTAIFISLYFHYRGWKLNSVLLRPALQVTAFLAAGCISVTRVSDHWHHWSDVLAGILLGSVFSLVVCFQFAFKAPKEDRSGFQPMHRASNEGSRVDHIRTKHRYRMSALFDM